MRWLLALLAVLVLAPSAQAATAETDSPRDPSLPPSQDFSHVASTFDPAAGSWSVAYTFYGPPSNDAWGNLNAQLYVGASQCAEFHDEIASFQEAPNKPNDPSGFATVFPPPDRQVVVAASKDKQYDGNTITLSMTDPSLVGVTPTCFAAGISHRGFLDTTGPVAFPGAPPPAQPGAPALKVALKSSRLTASRHGVVKVGLKPFKRAATGIVTLRQGGKEIGRKSYRAKAGKAVKVAVKLSAAARRALKRRHTLRVRVIVTAQSGEDVVSKTVRARVRAPR
jgi:hypothetical protein